MEGIIDLELEDLTGATLSLSGEVKVIVDGDEFEWNSEEEFLEKVGHTLSNTNLNCSIRLKHRESDSELVIWNVLNLYELKRIRGKDQIITEVFHEIFQNMANMVDFVPYPPDILLL